MKHRRASGLSLVELMVVIAVVGIILSVAVPSFTELLNSRRVQSIAAEISSDLALARAESGLRPQSVAVYFKENDSMSCYTIGYYGASGTCDCTRGTGSACNGREFKTNQIPKKLGVTFRSGANNWDPPFAVGVINFKSPQMTAHLPDFVVHVVGVKAKLDIQLSTMGRISTCSPGGSMSGVVPC